MEHGAEVLREFHCRWLVVATGEHSEVAVPEFPGLEDFGGKIMHTSSYKNGAAFAGEKVVLENQDLTSIWILTITMLCLLLLSGIL